jgi:hypothetical protein
MNPQAADRLPDLPVINDLFRNIFMRDGQAFVRAWL